MTVRELIEKLKEFGPDLEVKYMDFERGPEDVEHVEMASTRAKEFGIKFDGDQYVVLS